MKKAVVLLVSFLGFAVPVFAGGADGFYKASEVEGHVKLAGQRLNLPIRPLRAALLRDGWVIVRDNRIPIRKARWAELLEEFRFKGIDGEATVEAPSDIRFRRDGKRWIGRAKKPLVVTQKGKYRKGFLSVSVTVKMRTSLPTKVRGDLLRMDAPIEIKALGLTARGSINLTAKRETPPLPPLPPAG